MHLHFGLVVNTSWYRSRRTSTNLMIRSIIFYAVVANVQRGYLNKFLSTYHLLGFAPQQSLHHGCPAGPVATARIILWGVHSYNLRVGMLWTCWLWWSLSLMQFSLCLRRSSLCLKNIEAQGYETVPPNNLYEARDVICPELLHILCRDRVQAIIGES